MVKNTLVYTEEKNLNLNNFWGNINILLIDCLYWVLKRQGYIYRKFLIRNSNPTLVSVIV